MMGQSQFMLSNKNLQDEVRLILNENYINQSALSIIKHATVEGVSFGNIQNDAQWKKLGKFRRHCYQQLKPYMLHELNDQGFDAYDGHGYVYVAWLKGEIIASVRLCQFPFETTRYIQPDILKQFLGPRFQSEYLEWTRLLIHPKIRIPYLLNALIVYAGMQTVYKSSFQKYFGYSTPMVKRLFSRFQISNNTLDFSIPQRGAHIYKLLKGDFVEDCRNFISKKFI